MNWNNLKTLNLMLVITSLMGYLEWGGGNSMFLFQGEYEVISKLFSEPKSVLHPFTFLPMIGQGLLLITLVQNQPSNRLSIIGQILVSILLYFMLIIGTLDLNIKIFASVIPFLVASFFFYKYLRQKK